MSDRILQHVFSDLRPHILPKLKAEADQLTGGSSAQKKASVETHRGDTYQFCYFIRKTEPHSVVIKSRHFRAVPRQHDRIDLSSSAEPSSPMKKRSKRKQVSKDTGPVIGKNKKRKTRDKPMTEPGIIEDEDVLLIDPSGKSHFTEQAGVDDVDVLVPPDGPNSPGVELEVDSEEEKPKPILQLSYQGFSIYGHCLCVVVEPWHVVRSMTSTLPEGHSRAVTGSRADTPLFLPEDYPVEDHEPSQHHLNRSYLNKAMDQGDISDIESDDGGGMMEFSQVLHNIGDSRPGAANDDDDMDGSILFGDADEFREL
ncbi:hypothetical protein B0H34DRAFT_688426 [Crassisporium funariophilum]|nr:hypothetical protein B0H34DRAFT_688426 [Crassisporium funariophilum]